MVSRRKHPNRWSPNDIHDWFMMLNAKRQIEMALYSFEEMEAANDALRYGKTRNDFEMHRTETRLWSSAQAFLASIAQFSDLFWTKPKRLRGDSPEAVELENERRARAVRLSRLCSVPANHPFHNRTVRNGYVHIFEAIEKYAQKHPGEGISDWGRISPHPRFDEEYGRMIRCIDPSTLEIHHLKSVIDSRKIARELTRIQGIIHEHLPADKRNDRLIRRLRKEGKAQAEKYEDMEPINLPNDVEDHHGPPFRPESPSQLLHAFQYRYNSVATGGNPEGLGDLFDLHGEIGYYGSNEPYLDGRKEVLQRFREYPPKKEIFFEHYVLESDTDIVVTFGWGEEEGPMEGLLHLRARNGKITWLRLFKISGVEGCSLVARHRREVNDGGVSAKAE